MKKLHYLTICVLSALTMAACQDDLTQADDSGLTESTPLIVRGSLAPSTSSRTSYAVGESGITCSWSEDDQIALGSADTSTAAVYTADTSGTDVEFTAVSTGVIASDGDTAYAWYPVTDDGGSHTAALLPGIAEQAYCGASFDIPAYDFLYSSAVATDGVLAFSFTHLFSFLHVNIATDAMSGYDGLIVSSTDDIAYESGATYDLTTGTLTGTLTTSIIYRIDEETLAEAGDVIDCYIALLPTASESTVTISLLKSDGTTGAELYEKTSPTTGFAAGHLYETKVSAIDIERHALIALYEATDGDNWTNNDNWCSEEDLSEWYGVTVSNGHVTRLNLNYNNLSGELPEEIGNLTSLRYLYLYRNSLSGEIPETIGNLTNLRYLYLHSNSLSGEIPETIGNLSYLYTLSLFSNNLTGEIPESIGNLTNLRYLYLYSNSLTGEIPESIGNLTSLTALYLYSNDLEGNLPASLANLSQLTAFRVYRNKLSGEVPSEIVESSWWTGMSKPIIARYVLIQQAGYGLTVPDPYADYTWTEYGTGSYTYCGAYKSGEDKSLTLYSCDNDNTLFKITNWAGGVDFLFTWNQSTNEIVVDTQPSGFTGLSYGDVYITEVNDYMSSEDYDASYYEDGVFYFNVIYFVSTGYFGYGYETFTLDTAETEE